jgi:hypothetical protein
MTVTTTGAAPALVGAGRSGVTSVVVVKPTFVWFDPMVHRGPARFV